jgi:hypothetical protein
MGEHNNRGVNCRLSTPEIERWCWALLLLAVLNWCACGIIAVICGGDGWGGYVENGRYFVVSHGIYSESSRAAFYFTKIHLVVSVALLLMGMIAGIVASILRSRRMSSLNTPKSSSPSALDVINAKR